MFRMRFKIERAFPSNGPEYYIRNRRLDLEKYPFADLGVGDSFYVFRVEAKPENVRASASSFMKRSRFGVKLECKTDKEGIRVTRIA